MKRILYSLFAFLLIIPSASASIIGYRHDIPSTNGMYSIEFPAYFDVLCGEDVQDYSFNMAAMAVDSLGMSAYIQVVENPYEGFCSQDVPLEELEKWAVDLAQSYYDNHDGIIQATDGEPGFVYHSERMRYVCWQYFHYDEEHQEYYATEHFSLFEPGYMIDISFMYNLDDDERFADALDVSSYICDSVIRHQ